MTSLSHHTDYLLELITLVLLSRAELERRQTGTERSAGPSSELFLRGQHIVLLQSSCVSCAFIKLDFLYCVRVVLRPMLWVAFVVKINSRPTFSSLSHIVIIEGRSVSIYSSHENIFGFTTADGA